MTSQKQIEANRRNAQFSTGPKTPEGKAIVGHNRIQHGAASTKLLLPEESSESFEVLKNAITNQFKPETPSEVILCNLVIENTWRLNRLVRIENGMAVKYEMDEKVESARKMITKKLDENNCSDKDKDLIMGLLAKGFDYGENFDEPEVKEAISKLANSTEILGNECLDIAKAFVKEQLATTSFVKLQQYRKAVERSFYQSLAKLEQTIEKRKAREAKDIFATVVE